jgi:DNA recombination protein RmuC
MNPTTQDLFLHHFDLIFPLAIVLLCSLIAVCILANYKSRMLRRQLVEKDKELASSRSQLIELQKIITNLKVQTAQLSTDLQHEQRHSAEKLTLIEKARDELRLQFQALAQQIFDEKSRTFSAQNKEKLGDLLRPFQAQMDSFRKRIDDIYINDTRDRVSLKEELLHLRQLNQQINEEAINLTKALKGDRKLQGNWGELVLERVLEQSGLRKGHEYQSQGGFRDNENQLLKPDVIIHLPDGKDIIVDSKVSLSAWERYINCENKEGEQVFLAQHVQAIREHIKGLSHKDYAALTGIRSLDFVLMFMPIEAAYAAALQNDDKLLTDAFVHKIIVVTPTTLLATLRTIENLWRFEHQNRNSQEIADQAGILYNKLCSFMEEMEKIGRQLSNCTATYDAAMNKLTHGRGNIIALAHALPELGVKIKKALPKSITEKTELDLKN